METIFSIQKSSDGNNVLTVFKSGFIFKDEIKFQEVPEGFLNPSERKKMMFIAPGAYVALNPDLTRRSSDINRCDAVCVHDCVTANDISAYMREIAPVGKDVIKDFLKQFKYQVIPFESTIIESDCFIMKTPESESFLIGEGINDPKWRYAYVGQQYADIKSSNLPVFTDTMFTTYQNLNGCKFDQDAINSLTSMINSGTLDTVKIAMISASYYDISTDESKNFAKQFISSLSSTNKNIMLSLPSGRAFINAVTGTI